VSADEPGAGRIEGREHILPVRIYYEDTDFSGLVYHANYLKYFERARSDFLRLAGVRHTALLAQETAIALLSIKVRFRAAARIDDALIVRSRYEALRGPRIVLYQAIWRGAALAAEADVEACCISLTGQAKRPPKLLVDKVTPFLPPAPSPF
jgi:acyl-CoA thioester hydrolase